jgi:hypothetical protein
VHENVGMAVALGQHLSKLDPRRLQEMEADELLRRGAFLLAAASWGLGAFHVPPGWALGAASAALSISGVAIGVAENREARLRAVGAAFNCLVAAAHSAVSHMGGVNEAAGRQLHTSGDAIAAVFTLALQKLI